MSLEVCPKCKFEYDYQTWHDLCPLCDTMTKVQWLWKWANDKEKEDK